MKKMKEIGRYLPEFHPKRLRKTLKRAWKTHINPPKESRIFLAPEKLPTITYRVAEVSTKAQPKQVVFDPETNYAYVSCMRGRALQIFKIAQDEIKHIDDIDFEDQCVEVLQDKGFLFVTTTNFERPPRLLKNKLWILDSKSHDILGASDTGGNWSKVIATNPVYKELLISNWHSHDVSVFDITHPSSPRLKQIVRWGEAPRGIAFLSSGNSAIVSGFYSGNIGVLERDKDGSWFPIYTSEPFDKHNYPGNMRHVLITPDDKLAIISNLGRNMIHFWDTQKKEFHNSTYVGKSPNSMDFFDSKTVIVSCRDSSSVYFVDIPVQSAVGKSQKTGTEPTGLCKTDGGFLTTCFKSNTLELHSYV